MGLNFREKEKRVEWVRYMVNFKSLRKHLWANPLESTQKKNNIECMKIDDMRNVLGIYINCGAELKTF